MRIHTAPDENRVKRRIPEMIKCLLHFSKSARLKPSPLKQSLNIPEDVIMVSDDHYPARHLCLIRRTHILQLLIHGFIDLIHKFRWPSTIFVNEI